MAFPLEVAGVGKAERYDKARHFVEKVDEIWHLVRDEAIKAQEQRGR